MPHFSLKQLLIGTALIAFGLAALVSLKRLADPFDNMAFTPAAWANADDLQRARMSRDLVRDHLQSALPRTQVEALIGPTNWVIKPSDPDGYRVRGAETHVYGIGTWPWEGFDDAFVYVHYDSSGKVIEAEITGY